MPSISLTSVRSSSDSTVERTTYLSPTLPVGGPFSGIISTPSCSFDHTHLRKAEMISIIVKSLTVDYHLEPVEFGEWLSDCDAFKQSVITGRL